MPSHLTQEIIGAAIKIHRKLGPGLLESAYEACLAYELQKLGWKIERQKAVPLFYEGVKLDCGFRADLIVDGRVAVELNAKRRCILLTRRNYCHTFGFLIYRLAF
jgi:GxxExxY protein